MKWQLSGTFLSAPSFEVEAHPELREDCWWGILEDPSVYHISNPLPVGKPQWVLSIIRREFSEEMQRLYEKKALWSYIMESSASSEKSLWEIKSLGVALYTVEVEGELLTLDNAQKWKGEDGFFHVKIKERASFSVHSFTALRPAQEEDFEDGFWEVSFITAAIAPKLLAGGFLYGPYVDLLLDGVDWKVFELPHPAIYFQRVKEENLFFSATEAKLAFPLVEKEVREALEACRSEAKETIIGERELLPPKGPLLYCPDLSDSERVWVIKEGLAMDQDLALFS